MKSTANQTARRNALIKMLDTGKVVGLYTKVDGSYGTYTLTRCPKTVTAFGYQPFGQVEHTGLDRAVPVVDCTTDTPRIISIFLDNFTNCSFFVSPDDKTNEQPIKYMVDCVVSPSGIDRLFTITVNSEEDLEKKIGEYLVDNKVLRTISDTVKVRTYAFHSEFELGVRVGLRPIN